MRKVIDTALELTTRNLDYKYGSADPASGGMDCSGFVFFVLTQSGIRDVPRDSSQQYVWLRRARAFEAVMSQKDDSFELQDLKPGDLRLRLIQHVETAGATKPPEIDLGEAIQHLQPGDEIVQGMLLVHLLAPRRRHHEQMGCRLDAQEVVEELQRLPVVPVQVVRDEQERPTGHEDRPGDRVE